MVFLCRLLPLILLFAAVPAHADPLLMFKTEPGDLRLREIASFLLENKSMDPGASYEAARIDLNGDGVDEALFRQTPAGCEPRAACPYFITGLSLKKPVLLGSFTARKVGISSEKEYGVTKLIVYNEQNNDFAYQFYFWNPYKQTFAGE